MPSLDELIATLDDISSVDDEAQLGRLDTAVRTLASIGDRSRAVSALLGVLERFPTADPFGVFWSILHAVESIPGLRGVPRRLSTPLSDAVHAYYAQPDAERERHDNR